MMGIDAILELYSKRIAVQIKKVSYRREASDRRFTKRLRTYADIIVEVPYLVIDLEELRKKLRNSRVKESARVRYENVLEAFNKNFIKFDNGFVVFKREYLKHIRQLIYEKIKTIEKGKKITYEEILTI